MDQTISCPKCGHVIELKEAVAGPVVEQIRAEMAQRLNAARHESQQLKDLLEAQKRRTDEAVSAEKSRADRMVLEAKREAEKELRDSIKAQVEADLLVSTEAKDRRIKDLGEILAKSQNAQAAAEKALADAELKVQSLDLEVARQVGARLATVRTEAKSEAEEQSSLRIKELEMQLISTRDKLAEAQKRAEQGSQQTQGEALEVDLQADLARVFPFDVLEEVKKGQRGGDCIQRVYVNEGVSAGAILWESKRTQAWGGDWAGKAKQDARTAGAEITVIVSEALPKSVVLFGEHEGVWVCTPKTAVLLAAVLRRGLVEVFQARRTAAGRQSKAEIVYDYLTGPEFKGRILGIAEPFEKMREDLNREKTAMMKHWSRREKQISRVLENAMGMYGDLQGLAGSDLGELEGGAALGVFEVEEEE